MKTTLLSLFLITLFTTNSKAQCWKAIAGGVDHTIVMKSDSTLWSAGKNLLGQLGNGTNTSNTYPLQLGTANNWDTIISVGANHNIGKKIDGSLWAWGDNTKGQLGIGSAVSNTNTPTQIGTATDWKKIVAGVNHSAALKSDSTLWLWGDNSMGQLGIGTTIASTNTPTQIGTAKWIAIAGKGNHMFGIQKDSTLWAWGYNQFGQLANTNTTTVQSNIPTQIGTAKWKAIAAGYGHSMAIKNDGTIWSCGYNQYGQLGIGTSGLAANTSTLTQIGTAKWVSVAVGKYHTLAINEIGLTLWAWGYNTVGQLGMSISNTQTVTPAQIDPSKWKTLTTGDNYSFGINDAGVMYAWGENTWQKLMVGSVATYESTLTLKSCVTVGVNELSINNNLISVYPNPSHHMLNLQNTSSLSITQVIIMDVTGREVISQRGNINTINVEHLQPGIYILKAQLDNKSYITKFIKD